MEVTGMSAAVNTADGGIAPASEKGENATLGRTYGENSPSDTAQSELERNPEATGEATATDGYSPAKAAGPDVGNESAVDRGGTPVTDGGEDAGDTPDEGAESNGAGIDYGELMRRDLATLKASFPELAGLNDIADMRGALRYAALRDLGLTAEEAYMAASAPRVRKDNRAHLSAPVTRGASTAMVGMSQGELHTARELFGDMTDADIYNLYKRVSR